MDCCLENFSLFLLSFYVFVPISAYDKIDMPSCHQHIVQLVNHLNLYHLMHSLDQSAHISPSIGFSCIVQEVLTLQSYSVALGESWWACNWVFKPGETYRAPPEPLDRAKGDLDLLPFCLWRFHCGESKWTCTVEASRERNERGKREIILLSPTCLSGIKFKH